MHNGGFVSSRNILKARSHHTQGKKITTSAWYSSFKWVVFYSIHLMQIILLIFYYLKHSILLEIIDDKPVVDLEVSKTKRWSVLSIQCQ